MALENSKLKLLLLDQDPRTLQLVKEALRKNQLDWEVIVCENAEHSLKILNEQKIFMIILDVNLRGSNVLEVFHAVPRLPIEHRPEQMLVLSELLDVDAQNHSRKQVTFMSKPATLAGLERYFKEHCAPQPPTLLKPSGGMNYRGIQLFSEGLVLVFHTLAGIEIKKIHSYLRKNEVLKGELGSVLELKDKTMRGNLVILSSASLAAEMVNRIFRDEKAPRSKLVKDILAEVANQVFGFAKRILNHTGGNSFELVIPRVLTPEECEIALPGENDFFVTTEFESDYGTIFLEIQILKK